jgi:hypothetical protein
MSQNVPKKPRKKLDDGLTKNQLKACVLLADDLLSDEKISAKCKISRKQLGRWKELEPFKAKIREMRKAFEDVALNHGLARKETRLRKLDDLHDKAWRIIEERATDPEFEKVPGGKTGLVCKTLKGIGKGDDFQVVEVYDTDTGLMKEIRAIHQQYAVELGQRVEKHEWIAPKELDAEIAALMSKGLSRSQGRVM